jgi:hypothetical protein
MCYVSTYNLPETLIKRAFPLHQAKPVDSISRPAILLLLRAFPRGNTSSGIQSSHVVDLVQHQARIPSFNKIFLYRMFQIQDLLL